MKEYLPDITSNRITLRKMTQEDLNDLYNYGKEDSVTEYTTWETYKSTADAQAFLTTVLSKYKMRVPAPYGVILTKENRLIGTAGIISCNHLHNSGELGYALAKECWGQGLATEAARAALEYGFRHMELHRIQAGCRVENTGSARVMEKVGMSFEGVSRGALYLKGQYYDRKNYSILASEYESR